MTGLCGKRERERARVQQPKDGEGGKREMEKREQEMGEKKIYI